MTTPLERTRAVIELGKAVHDIGLHLQRKGRSVRVPRIELVQLCAWLRHYPMPVELSATARKAPEIWGEAAE